MENQRNEIDRFIQKIIGDYVEKELLENNIPFIRSEDYFNIPKASIPTLDESQINALKTLFKDGCLMTDDNINNWLDKKEGF